jgi:hypothetical protein
MEERISGAKDSIGIMGKKKKKKKKKSKNIQNAK